MQCKQAGILVGGKWEKMMDVSRRVYSTETIAPTLHTCGGELGGKDIGRTESKNTIRNQVRI